MNRNRTALLFTMLLASFIPSFMASSLNVALPVISNEYGMNAVTTGWITSSFLLVTAVFVLPFGRISDLRGRRLIFIIGLVINFSASVCAVVSPDQHFLLAFRALQGVGAAMLFATANPILISAFSPQERGRVLGLGVGAVYAGLSAGPFLGGILTHLAGWRSVFIFNAAMVLLIMVLAFRCIEKDHPESHGEPFDYLGSIINGIFLSSLIFAMTLVPAKSAWFLFALSAVSGLLFVYVQLKSSHPILRLSLFKGNSVFLKSNIAAMINYSATFAVSFLLSLYLHYMRGYTPQKAGLVLLCQPAMQMLFSPTMGRLSDRIEPSILSSLGMGMIAAGLAVFVFLGAATPMPVIIICLMLLGVGFALFSSPNTNAVMGSVSKRDLGMASALLSTMRVFGQILSMGIAMLVFSLVIGRVKIDSSATASFLHAMKICFTVFSVLCIAGIYFSLSRGSLHGKKEDNRRQKTGTKKAGAAS